LVFWPTAFLSFDFQLNGIHVGGIAMYSVAVNISADWVNAVFDG